MFGKILINTFLILTVFSFQTAFISALPAWFNGLNFIIIAVVFILIIGNLETALWWSIGCGALLDLFSFSNFSIHIISLILSVISTYFLLKYFFTNRSLYSFLVLSAFALIFYDLLLFLLNFLFLFFKNTNAGMAVNLNSIKNEIIYLLANLFLVIILFYLINFITNKLKPVFLYRKSPKTKA